MDVKNDREDSREKVLRLNKKFHDEQADYYDQDHNLELIDEMVLTRYLDPEDRLLDLGSGTGNVSRLHHGECFAIDISCQMMEKNPATHRIQGETASLPFESGVFDSVTARSVLHHLPNLEETFAEVSRVLKDGGLFIIMHEPIGYPKWKHLIKTLRVVGGRKLFGYTNSEWLESLADQTNSKTPFHLKDIVNLHEQQGISVNRIEPFFERQHYLRYELPHHGITKRRFFYVGEV